MTQNFLPFDLAVYRTWHENAEEAEKANGLYGEIAITSPAEQTLALQMYWATVTAYGAPSEFALALRVYNGTWRDVRSLFNKVRN